MDEIGTCPNIEVDLQVTDTPTFFMKPFPYKEEDKPVIDKEMKMLVHLDILKEDIPPYSST